MMTVHRGTAAIDAPRSPAGTRLDPLSSGQNKSEQSKEDTFGQQIASALQGYLGTGNSPSHLEISIDAQPGQNSGARQFVVTVRDLGLPASLPALPSASSRTVPPSSISTRVVPNPNPATPEPQVYTSMMVNGVINQYVPPAAPAEPEIRTAADAYWAQQPKEVQALRTIESDAERQNKASELIDKGYAIDTEIMVFGWDPYATMKHREDSGYTWIPAAGQPNIPLGPGLSFPGLPRYDPDRPPLGSIAVSTAFAQGLEATIPFLGVTFQSTS
jgi:hypothetical protein